MNSGKGEYIPHYCSKADDIVILHEYRDKDGNKVRSCLCAPVCRRGRDTACDHFSEFHTDLFWEKPTEEKRKKNVYAGPTL